jgi:dTDP-glucose 4,6-dehydratase
MKTILTTGGCGFIGSTFIRHILSTRDDCIIINIDKLTYAGNLENLIDVDSSYGNKRYFFEKGDIADRDFIHTIYMNKEKYPTIDIVVNFAAESHVDRSILDATPFVETNIKGTQILLDAARQYGVKKFVQVSTDEVYGTLTLTGTDRFLEENALLPNSPYSASKASADLLCKAYHKTHGFPVVITRCCNNYGAYQFPEKLIPLMILNTLERKPLPVYGDGLHVREWIHVLDHCKGIEFVMEQGEFGEIYNIGSDQEMPNLEMVKTILRTVSELTHTSASELEKLITFVKDRPGHDRRYAIDSGKLQAMGWKTQIPFSEGMRQTVQWYLDNKDWCEKVRSGEYRTYYEKWYGRK